MSAVPQREEQLNMEAEVLVNTDTAEEVFIEDTDETVKEILREESDAPEHVENLFVAFLDTVGQKFVYLVLALCFLVFTFYSFKYTHIFKSYEHEYLEAHFDKSLKNVVFFLLLIAICKLIYNLLHRIQGKLKGTEYALYALCILTFLVSAIWVKLSGSRPYGDQAFICTVAADFVNGIYDCMNPGGYIGMFSHQVSIVCIMEMIYRLFGVGNYRMFQYLNVCLLVLLVWGGYKLVDSLFEKEECNTYYLILMTLCLPILILYVPYVYGEMGSITWMVLSIWQLLKGCKNNEKKAFVYAILFAFLAVSFRKNAIIFVIAECLVLLFESIKQKKMKYFYMIVALVLTISIGQSALIKFYELRSGIQLGKGVSSITYVAMGLQDGWPGPGWFNNYNKEVYQLAGLDSELASEMAKANINERLFHLNANKPAAVEFIKNKLKTQWIEPTYQAFWMNYSFEESISNTELVEKVFNGAVGDGLMKLMNFTQLVVYGLFTFAMGMLLVQKRNMLTCLPAITILGGFLFSIIWEAKSRYVLPYYVLMVLYAAYGMYCLHQMVEHIIAKYFASRPEMMDAKRIDEDSSLNDATLGGFDDRRDTDKPRRGRIVLFRRRH